MAARTTCFVRSRSWGMTSPSFDLQAHSTHSDGTLAPREVVAAAARAGIELMALTDHDTVSGVPEALAAGSYLGIGVVPAVELSAVDGDHEELHVLGYGVDHADEEFETTLVDLRADRERRVFAMAQALDSLGFTIDTADLEARRSTGRPLGRPHLAAAVLDEPANAQRLREERISGAAELFPAYLVPGAAAYVPRRRPTVAEAIDLVHGVGGLAVWAHPFWDVDDPAEVERALRRFCEMGLDGVEAFYATHTSPQTEWLADLAEELGILTTGSADFHGPDHKLFARFGAFETGGRHPRLGPIADMALAAAR
jgi:predicted metal-dependent phosphoesterase TrpH